MPKNNPFRLEAMGEEVPDLREKVRPRKSIDYLVLVRRNLLHRFFDTNRVTQSFRCFVAQKQSIDTCAGVKVDAAEKELAKEKQKHNLIKDQAQKMQNQAAAHEKQAVEQARPPPPHK